MGNLSDKVKIVYLIMVIVFAMGVFVYLLDSWGIINMEEYIPFLEEESAIVATDDDNPTELEWEKIRKEREKIEEERIALEEHRAEIEELKANLDAREQELTQREKGLEEERERFEASKVEYADRERMIQNMADRITNMPPEDAVAIAGGWSNADLVDVFRQMEADAAEAGTQSIVPYLLTLMPRDRAAVITTLMMDAEATRLPN
ncbi:MAG: DUF4200 domain-containing protein [Leptospiraceae bacterium]|nr:DUF4200 domain-containing protein [Leptospiraceae bacterium]MCB1320211.1 DUF4200 domain-containing protein [Leptospiraceae bacterium]